MFWIRIVSSEFGVSFQYHLGVLFHPFGCMLLGHLVGVKRGEVVLLQGFVESDRRLELSGPLAFEGIQLLVDVLADLGQFLQGLLKEVGAVVDGCTGTDVLVGTEFLNAGEVEIQLGLQRVELLDHFLVPFFDLLYSFR